MDGLFPNSSVGEFIHLDLQERKKLTEIVVDQASGRVPVIAGISASSADTSLEFGQHASKVGVQAVVAMPPYFSDVPRDSGTPF